MKNDEKKPPKGGLLKGQSGQLSVRRLITLVAASVWVAAFLLFALELLTGGAAVKTALEACTQAAMLTGVLAGGGELTKAAHNIGQKKGGG